MSIVLASASPRRRELLEMMGLEFEIVPAKDELDAEGLPPAEAVAKIALGKAMSVAKLRAENDLVIAADTLVCLDGELLGKPKDEAEAKSMLMRLSGKTHQVITGVCLTTASMQKTFATVTDVTFAALTDEEVDYYVTRYQPMDKAGSYGVQEWIGFVGVENLSGSYFNVMGLPIQRLYTELKKL